MRAHGAPGCAPGGTPKSRLVEEEGEGETEAMQPQIGGGPTHTGGEVLGVDAVAHSVSVAEAHAQRCAHLHLINPSFTASCLGFSRASVRSPVG